MNRVNFIRNLAVFLFIFLILSLARIQVIKGEYYLRLSENNRIRILPLIGPRGRILDRSGNILVDNALAFDIAIVPQEAVDLEKIFNELGGYLGTSSAALKQTYKINYAAPFVPVNVWPNADIKTALEIEETRDTLPGVVVQTRPQRDYLYNDTAGQVLGYIGKIAPLELEQLESYGYTIRDLVGKSGLEKIYDRYLKGKNGGTQIEVDSYGRKVKILGHKEPVKGDDLVATLDLALQTRAGELLQGKKGAITVMELSSGDILAMASSPSLDPNIFIAGENAKIRGLFSDNAAPFLNRNFDPHCAYPPGSTFKIVTATAALEEKKITLDTRFNCPGKYMVGKRAFYCWKKDGHGDLNVTEALKYSCNVFFYNAGKKVGPEILAGYAKRFGLGRPVGLKGFREEKGIVPEPRWKSALYQENWYEGDTVNFAIGQGYLLATPLQVLMLGAIVANEGRIAVPRLIKTVDKPRFINTELSPKVLKVVKQGMVQVVAAPDGTGHRAFREGLGIVAKTGTAQAQRDKSHAWFVGFVPNKNPRLAFVVFLEYGGHGGEEAADIAAAICELAKTKGYF